MVVGKAATATTVTIGATQQRATVAPVTPGAGTPTGTVTFASGGATLGTATLTGGVATLSQPLPAGATGVTATYAGDGDFTGSAGSAAVTAPKITAAVSPNRPGSGWWRGSVTVTFTCTPGSAPLAAACPAPVTLADDGANQSVTRSISATDGGTASVTVGDLDLDGTGPDVAIKGVEDGATYKGHAPKARCEATDGLSGVRSCDIETKTENTKRSKRVVVVATATDRAGNVSTDRVIYRVVKKKG